jgi:hypothetical protein
MPSDASNNFASLSFVAVVLKVTSNPGIILGGYLFQVNKMSHLQAHAIRTHHK